MGFDVCREPFFPMHYFNLKKDLHAYILVLTQAHTSLNYPFWDQKLLSVVEQLE